MELVEEDTWFCVGRADFGQSPFRRGRQGAKRVVLASHSGGGGGGDVTAANRGRGRGEKMDHSADGHIAMRPQGWTWHGSLSVEENHHGSLQLNEADQRKMPVGGGGGGWIFTGGTDRSGSDRKRLN